MGVVDISDYMVLLAGKICYEKFNNDIMLVFNNFSRTSIESITDLIKSDIRKIEDIGVLLDHKLLNIYCSMYLGISWSMYRKGKGIAREDRALSNIIINSINGENYITEPMNYIENSKYKEIVDDLSLRYFSLYVNNHIRDIINRMEVTRKSTLIGEETLTDLILTLLKNFSINTLIIGVLDELNNNK